MKFFNIDCHVSVISDVKNVFESLGHSVDHWSISGHRHIFNFPECPSPVINSRNWRDIDERFVDRFYDEHKNDLDVYDGFVCAYPVYFLKLFERFNKPIIVLAPIRYDFPLYDRRKSWLEDSLKNNPNIIRIANNQFDQKYCEKFLGNTWEWIPSLCAYTNAVHKKEIDNFIVAGFHNPDLGQHFKRKSTLGQHSWSHLFSHSGIVHFPYNASQMSIFEQNTAGVPLAFPSLDFAIELFHSHANPQSMTGGTFSQLNWPNTFPDRHLKHFINKEWLSYCDFYNGTINCEFFNSLDEITDCFQRFKFKPNQSNQELIFSKWKDILSQIKS